MLSRYAVPVLCAAAIVFACARPHSADSTPAAGVLAGTPAAGAASAATVAPSSGTRVSKAMREEIEHHPLASSLDVSVRGAGASPSEREVRFALHVINRADKKVELLFPSGQTHDFVVRDEAGREVWRWSEGRMYTQAVQSRLLDGEESATYEETWSPGAHRGRFSVAAELRSSNHVVQQVAEFVLP